MIGNRGRPLSRPNPLATSRLCPGLCPAVFRPGSQAPDSGPGTSRRSRLSADLALGESSAGTALPSRCEDLCGPSCASSGACAGR